MRNSRPWFRNYWIVTVPERVYAVIMIGLALFLMCALAWAMWGIYMEFWKGG